MVSGIVIFNHHLGLQSIGRNDLMHILVIGKTGQLGQSFQKEAGRYPAHSFTFAGRKELDLSNNASISAYFEHNNFNVIINCAAYTAVDKAESEVILADQINHQAVKQLAQIAKKQQIKFIHISTDYVFNGDSDKPYLESDTPDPINIYGKTKQAGEQVLYDIMPSNALIIRSGWIYSQYGNNFFNTMLRLARDRNQLKIVSDQVGTPTYATDLAKTILHIINHKYFTKNFATTIYHYSNTGECSWYEFAKAIFTLSSISCDAIPIATNKYPTPAKRPKYTVLNKDKIIKKFDLAIPPWQVSLKECIESSNKI